jgi:hypothetical protein
MRCNEASERANTLAVLHIGNPQGINKPSQFGLFATFDMAAAVESSAKPPAHQPKKLCGVQIAGDPTKPGIYQLLGTLSLAEPDVRRKRETKNNRLLGCAPGQTADLTVPPILTEGLLLPLLRLTVLHCRATHRHCWGFALAVHPPGDVRATPARLAE